MKALEAFSSKDVRTCARLMHAIMDKGGTVEDLFAGAKLPPPAKHYNLAVPTSLAKELFQIPIQTASILNSIGWVVLRDWLRIHKLLEGGEIVPKTVQNFVRKERRKWLEDSPSGKIKP